MAGPLLAFTIISAFAGAASSMYRGNAARRQAQNNALATRAAAHFNAEQAVRGTAFNSAMTIGTSVVNAAMAGAASSVQAALIMREAQYNAAIQYATGMYNAALIEREEALLWQEHDLNKFIYKRRIARDTKAVLVSYGGANIELGNIGEAPDLAALDIRSEGMLQMAIMKFSVDVEAYKMHEAAARSRWEAGMNAIAITESGKNQATGAGIQGMIQSAGMLMQGRLDAASNMFQGVITSNAILHEASWAENQYNRAGRQAWRDGLFMAGTRIGQAAFSYAAATYTPSSELLGSHPNAFAGYGGPQSVYNPSATSPATTGPTIHLV